MTFVLRDIVEVKDDDAPSMTHVYAVKVRLGSGKWRWLYSVPLVEADANREAHQLRMTGHRVLVLTTRAAARRQKRSARG